MNKKFKTILSLSLSSAVLLGSVSTFVGVYYTASTDNVYISPRINSSPTYDDNSGYLDSKITDLLKVQPSITNVVSNQYSANQSFNSIQESIQNDENLSFYEYNDKDVLESKNISDAINADNIQKDIFYSFEQAFNCNQQIKLFLVSSNIEYVDKQLSFDYKLNLKKSSSPISFSFNNISFFVPKGDSFVITFKVEKQPISINLSNNSIYWSVSNVDVLIDDNSINELNTTLTFNSQINSYTIPYQFTNLSTENDYKEIIQDANNSSEINLTSLQQQLYDHIQENKELSFASINLISEIFNELKSNPTTATFLSDLSSDFADYLVKIKIVPDESQSIITDFLKNQKSVTEIIDTYKDKLSDIIMEYLPTSYSSLINKDVLTSYIIPSLLNKDESIISLVNDFVPSEFAPLANTLLNLLFQENTKPLDFIKSIFESSELNDLISNNDSFVKYQPIVNLLKAIFQNQNQSILKTFADNKQLLLNLINMQMNGGNGQQGAFSQVLNMFITSSGNNFNESNLLSLITLTLSPLASFMADSSNYTIVQDDKDEWAENLTVDTNNKKYSFKYNMSIKFVKDFTINLLGFEKICPTIFQAAWGIYFVNNVSIKNNDEINWVFSASNQDLIYSPIKQKDGNYYSSYIVPFNFNLRLNMPGLFNSISSQYQRYFAFGGEGLGYSFVKSIFISFLLPDYDFYESFNYIDSNKMVLNYNDSLYIPDITYSFNQNYENSKIQDCITNEQVNSTSLTFKGFWGIGTTTENISGSKPTIASEKEKSLLEYLYPEYDNWMKLPKELQPIISVISTVNGYASFGGSLNITLGIKILNISIQFPYKVYNKDSKKFESSFNKTISI